jgi:hypothetical protein
MSEIDSPKLNIKYEMAMLDSKNREFYDDLTDDERKKFSNYLMIRWGSCVGGSAEMQAYYLMSTNTKLNKNFFAIPKAHDKLNWLAATTISPGMGNQYHQYLRVTNKAIGNSKVAKFIATLYPTMKHDDMVLLEKMNDVSEWKKLAVDMGMDKAQIKKTFG